MLSIGVEDRSAMVIVRRREGARGAGAVFRGWRRGARRGKRRDAKIGGPREGRHHHPPRPRGLPPHQGGALAIDAYRAKKKGERRGRGSLGAR